MDSSALRDSSFLGGSLKEKSQRTDIKEERFSARLRVRVIAVSQPVRANRGIVLYGFTLDSGLRVLRCRGSIGAGHVSPVLRIVYYPTSC